MQIDPKDLCVGDVIVAHLELVVSKIDLSDHAYPIEAMLTDGLPILLGVDAIVEKIAAGPVRAGGHARQRSNPYLLYRVRSIVGDRAWVHEIDGQTDSVVLLDDLFAAPSPDEDE